MLIHFMPHMLLTDLSQTWNIIKVVQSHSKLSAALCVCVTGSDGSRGVCGGAVAARLQSAGSGQQGALSYAPGGCLRSCGGSEGPSEGPEDHPRPQGQLWLHTAALGLL